MCILLDTRLAVGFPRKPHLRLHFHLFDGKTPLWWVAKLVSSPFPAEGRKTNGYSTAAAALQAAARL